MSSSHQADHLLDRVFYCGLFSGITVLGILGNLLLLIVFYHPSLILHKSLFHSYLRAIAATDLVFLIYNLMYGAFVCQGLSDPPREVKARRTAAIRLTGYRTGDEPGAGGVAEVHLRPPDAAVRPLRLPGPYLLPPAGLS